MRRKTSKKSGRYVVVHKNPINPTTKGGKLWDVDGLFRNWNYTQAELHAKRCEYGAVKIPYEIIPVEDVGKYIPSLRPKDDEEE